MLKPQITGVEAMEDRDIRNLMTGMTRRLDGAGLKDVNRQTMVGLASRLIALAKEGRPDEGPSHIEVAARQYTDPAIFEDEKRAIFDRMPFMAGLSRDVAEPGDYIRIDHLATPMFVTRAKSGKVKAFVNSCRHRGAALVYEERGSGKSGFTCPYHAWSYDLDGRLVGVSCNASFGEPDKSGLGLIEVDCEEVSGIIFVSPKPGQALDMEAYLGPDLANELGHWGFDKVAASRTGPIELDGNWKLVLETFLESYHFAYAHKDNLAHYYNCNVNTVDRFGRHLRMATSLRSIVPDLDGKPADSWVPENYIHVKYVLFPGAVMINTPQVLEMFRIVPKSVDKTIVLHSCYSRMPLDAPGNAELFERIWESAHTVVQSQDFPYGVTTSFAALKSGALPKLLFGKNEWAVHIAHDAIRAAIEQANAV